MNASKIFFVILICLASLFGVFFGLVFFLGSGFIFAGDIDLIEEQRNAAQIWVGIGSIFGLILMIASFLALIFSIRIAELFLKLFGTDSDTKLHL
jgi:uncharacterized membrane protein YhiD involved in acid resistance